MSEVKTLATLCLGGMFDHDELGDIDIHYSMGNVEALQERLVTGIDDVHIELVSRLDYDALQAELSALREELAVTDKEVEGLQSALSDAEQRNAILAGLLQDTKTLLGNELSYELYHKLALHIKRIDAALKPTESGASDKCVADGGTCGLGGQCVECPHKESGASE